VLFIISQYGHPQYGHPEPRVDQWSGIFEHRDQSLEMGAVALIHLVYTLQKFAACEAVDFPAAVLLPFYDPLTFPIELLWHTVIKEGR
jgi:hypothetical protein